MRHEVRLGVRPRLVATMLGLLLLGPVAAGGQEMISSPQRLSAAVPGQISYSRPRIAYQADGGFALAWWATPRSAVAETELRLQLQRFAATGVSRGQLIDVGAVGSKPNFSVAGNGRGRVVVAWRWDGAIRARVYGDDGVPVTAEVVVSTVVETTETAVALGSDDRFAVAWSAAEGAVVAGAASSKIRFGRRDVHLRAFDAMGTPTTSALRAPADPSGDQREPAIGFDGANRIVLAWSEQPITTGSVARIEARTFNAQGQALTADTPASAVPEAQYQPALSVADQQVVLAWSGDRFGATQRRVFLQRFDSGSLMARGGELDLGPTVAGSNVLPVVAIDNDQHVHIAWVNENQDPAQPPTLWRRDLAPTGQFTDDAQPVGTSVAFDVVESGKPQIAAGAAGAVLVWAENEEARALIDVWGQRLLAPPNAIFADGYESLR